MKPDPSPGVALSLYWRRSMAGPGFRASVVKADAQWCGRDWWPFTASGVGLFILRERWGEAALCAQPAR